VLRSGNRLALARLLTQVENDTPAGQTALNELFPYTGRAHLVGVTGAPGTGKSSLVNQLARHYRRPPDDQPARSVAIVAVDPSSPFTGGAVLGDRVRMRDLSGDPGVFIRSMASRGVLGGLARATAGVVQVLDAAGFDMIIIETVGAGQAEVDIARLAHTTLVIETPGAGDDIQTIKAGILEIADILVVNKADRSGVDNTERALRAMIEMEYNLHRGAGTYHSDAVPSIMPCPPEGEKELPSWTPPVLRTIATQATGIPALTAAIDHHAAYLHRSGEWQHRDTARMQNELESLLSAALISRWRAQVPEAIYNETLLALCQRKISPHEAVRRLVGS
jgi:LAO/AO transport system kinase